MKWSKELVALPIVAPMSPLQAFLNAILSDQPKKLNKEVL